MKRLPKHPLFKYVNRFANNNRGNIVGIAAFAMAALTGIAGGAVDAATYMNVNSQFQASIDNAIMAAVPVYQTRNIDEVAREFFYANFPEKYHDNIDLNAINIIELPDVAGWEISVEAKIKTNFAKYIGVDEFYIQHKARVEWDISKRVEDIFTLDTSASMCMQVVRDNFEDHAYKMSYVPDYSCKKLNAMKDGVKYVIENGFPILENTQAPVFYAGFIPFNHKVKLPNLEKIPEPLAKTERNAGYPDYYTVFDDAEPLSEIIPLTAITSENDKAFLKSKITNIQQSPMGLGWTRSNIAALTAGMMFDPTYNDSFKHQSPPVEFDVNGEDVDKVLIMMTDGANIGCCYAAHPEGNFENQYLYLYELDNMHLIDGKDEVRYKQWHEKYHLPYKGICNQLKDAGVTIYSIVFDVDDRDPGGQAIKDAYKRCAQTDKHYFDATDEVQLDKAYKTIAQSFMSIRLTY
ncbi:MAG: hypothetical protein AAF621_02775 [Pseudomonadota bacterium]